MREIKFRAYSTVSGGFDFFNLEDALMINPEKISRKSIREDLTLEQFSGLKDKNGAEIYEGDVVKCKVKNGASIARYIGEIKFSDVYCSFIAAGVKQYFGEKISLHELYMAEVIGNIHENPGLLD